MHEDLASFGATPEQLAQLTEERPPEAQHFDVLPRNWLAVQVFQDCCGQWLRDAAGQYMALDRKAVQASIELWPVPGKQRSDTFHRIRVMEAVALEEFKRRAKRD